RLASLPDLAWRSRSSGFRCSGGIIVGLLNRTVTILPPRPPLFPRFPSIFNIPFRAPATQDVTSRFWLTRSAWTIYSQVVIFFPFFRRRILDAARLALHRVDFALKRALILIGIGLGFAFGGAVVWRYCPSVVSQTAPRDAAIASEPLFEEVAL